MNIDIIDPPGSDSPQADEDVRVLVRQLFSESDLTRGGRFDDANVDTLDGQSITVAVRGKIDVWVHANAPATWTGFCRLSTGAKINVGDRLKLENNIDESGTIRVTEVTPDPTSIQIRFDGEGPVPW